MEYQLSKDYVLHVDAKKTPLGHHLSISTQWLGAKNPNEKQRRFSVTVPRETLHKIGHLLTIHAKEE